MNTRARHYSMQAEGERNKKQVTNAGAMQPEENKKKASNAATFAITRERY